MHSPPSHWPERTTSYVKTLSMRTTATANSKNASKNFNPFSTDCRKKMSEPQSETIRCTRTETKINGIEGLPEGIRRKLIDALQQSLCEDRQAEAETKSEEAA